MILHRDWDGTYRTTRERWTELFVVLIRRDFWGCPGFVKPYGFFVLRTLYNKDVNVLVAWYWFPFAWIQMKVALGWYLLASIVFETGHLWKIEGEMLPTFWLTRIRWHKIPREDLMEDL
jgi:hypothetical protein